MCYMYGIGSHSGIFRIDKLEQGYLRIYKPRDEARLFKDL